VKQFELAVRLAEGDTINRAASYHNLGNSYLKAGKVDEAIEAYKNGLRLDPKANDTRYNLAFALNMKKKQEEQQKQDQKDNKDKQDQQKQDQQKQDEEKKQQQKKEQKKQEEQDQSQQDKSKMSEANAAQILQALQNDEDEVQKKIKKQQKTKTYHVKKDW